MKAWINYIVIFLLGGLILTACYPDNEIYPEETDTVYTTYLPGTDFSQMKYFVMVDSILRRDTNLKWFGNEQYDDLIMARYQQNLELRGFKNAEGIDTVDVDFMVVISDISSLDITYYWSYLPYGYLYPDYNNASFNAFFPLPPPSNIIVNAKTGLLVDILAYEEQVSDTTKVYWRAITNGAQTTFMETRLKTNIDKMFIQSPNLKSLK
jgi:hypothetical protein